MKSINLQILVATAVAFVLFASSCHNSDTQGNNSSANDMTGGKSDSIKTNSNSANSAKTGDSVNALRNHNNTNSPDAGTAHSWSLTITPNTTKNQLDSVAAIWKKENIDLTISKLKCDGNGNLIKIKGSVVINRKNGNANGDFKSENLSSIQIKVDDSPNVSIKGD